MRAVSKIQVFNNYKKKKPLLFCYWGWELLIFLITYDKSRSTFGPLRPWRTTGGLYTFIIPYNLYTSSVSDALGLFIYEAAVILKLFININSINSSLSYQIPTQWIIFLTIYLSWLEEKVNLYSRVAHTGMPWTHLVF